MFQGDLDKNHGIKNASRSKTFLIFAKFFFTFSLSPVSSCFLTFVKFKTIQSGSSKICATIFLEKYSKFFMQKSQKMYIKCSYSSLPAWTVVMGGMPRVVIWTAFSNRNLFLLFKSYIKALYGLRQGYIILYWRNWSWFHICILYNLFTLCLSFLLCYYLR